MRQRVYRLGKRFGEKLADFVKETSLQNDVKCRIFEPVREHTGIPKREAKVLLGKSQFATHIEKFLPENEKLTAKEFFELGCLLENFSPLGSESDSKAPQKEIISDVNLKTIITLSRKYQKPIGTIINKIKKGDVSQ